MQRLCIVVVFSALVLGVGIKHEVLGQEAPEDTNIEEALSGFDDDDSGTLDEDVLSGFGDDDGFEVSSEDSESGTVASLMLYRYTVVHEDSVLFCFS